MSLKAISPIDGRYSSKVESLSAHFSEFALIRERCRVEIAYLLALNDLKLPHMMPILPEQADFLRKCYEEFDENDAGKVKDYEAQTNHDVKAVEYYLKHKLEEGGMTALKEWVHFALTSQDINNTAVPILVRDAVKHVLEPALSSLVFKLNALARAWADVPMLSHTHGQPASPTTVGKEIRVFVERLQIQQALLGEIRYYGKFGGAVGNFNAHRAAYPDIHWPSFADRFLQSLGLIREQTTTQIDHYDHLATLFHVWIRINSILNDLCRDIWSYISMEYFTQKAIEGEVGSSTMPHKVNPIDFENAEGNLGIANALFGFLAEKLPVSRLQRDLTDSTVLRNIGVPFAHTLIALQSLQKGLEKIDINRQKLSDDLDSHWVILAEPIQTILRREGIEQPYELLKSLTRGTGMITKEELWKFIDNLRIREDVKEELKRLTPQNYTGFV